MAAVTCQPFANLDAPLRAHFKGKMVIGTSAWAKIRSTPEIGLLF
ncbi:MAG: hypothetical protein P9C48_08535 [Defluviicoccus sp.]|nr:hypothetical protein [Defluviicoccus sp.]